MPALQDMVDSETVEEIEEEQKRQRREGTKWGSELNDE